MSLNDAIKKLDAVAFKDERQADGYPKDQEKQRKKPTGFHSLLNTPLGASLMELKSQAKKLNATLTSQDEVVLTRLLHELQNNEIADKRDELTDHLEFRQELSELANETGSDILKEEVQAKDKELTYMIDDVLNLDKKERGGIPMPEPLIAKLSASLKLYKYTNPSRHTMQTADADFESKHPRDNDGKFTEGAGGGNSARIEKIQTLLDRMDSGKTKKTSRYNRLRKEMQRLQGESGIESKPEGKTYKSDRELKDLQKNMYVPPVADAKTMEGINEWEDIEKKYHDEFWEEHGESVQEFRDNYDHSKMTKPGEYEGDLFSEFMETNYPEVINAYYLDSGRVHNVRIDGTTYHSLSPLDARIADKMPQDAKDKALKNWFENRSTHGKDNIFKALGHKNFEELADKSYDELSKDHKDDLLKAYYSNLDHDFNWNTVDDDMRKAVAKRAFRVKDDYTGKKTSAIAKEVADKSFDELTPYEAQKLGEVFTTNVTFRGGERLRPKLRGRESKPSLGKKSEKQVKEPKPKASLTTGEHEGKEYVTKIQDALSGAGFKTLDTMHNRGYNANEISSNWKVNDTEDGGLEFTVTIDGKEAGVDYDYYTESDSDGEERDLHEPTNPGKPKGDLTKAFENMGFNVKGIGAGGYQMHWDHGISYHIKTDKPKGLKLR